MKGKILGYTDNSGAILGEDGERYSLNEDEWRGARPPQPQDEVDFVATDGVAGDVYPTKSASLFGPGVSDTAERGTRALREGIERAASGDAGQRVSEMVRRYPQTIPAAIILLAAFVLPYMAEEVSLVSFYPDVSAQIGQLVGLANAFGSEAGGGATLLKLLVGVSLVFWAVPPLAGWLIWRAYNGERSKSEIWLMLLSIFAGLYYLGVREAIVAATSGSMFGGDMVRSGMMLGSGGWIIVLSGIAILILRTRSSGGSQTEE